MSTPIIPAASIGSRARASRGLKDFAGKKIGNPPGDAARALWPALAKANGIDPNAVTWVNIGPNAKLAALKPTRSMQ